MQAVGALVQRPLELRDRPTTRRCRGTRRGDRRPASARSRADRAQARAARRSPRCEERERARATRRRNAGCGHRVPLRRGDGPTESNARTIGNPPAARAQRDGNAAEPRVKRATATRPARVACVLVPELPAAAQLRAHPELAESPLAVVSEAGPARDGALGVARSRARRRASGRDARPRARGVQRARRCASRIPRSSAPRATPSSTSRSPRRRAPSRSRRAAARAPAKPPYTSTRPGSATSSRARPRSRARSSSARARRDFPPSRASPRRGRSRCSPRATSRRAGQHRRHLRRRARRRGVVPRAALRRPARAGRRARRVAHALRHLPDRRARSRSRPPASRRGSAPASPPRSPCCAARARSADRRAARAATRGSRSTPRRRSTSSSRCSSSSAACSRASSRDSRCATSPAATSKLELAALRRRVATRCDCASPRPPPTRACGCAGCGSRSNAIRRARPSTPSASPPRAAPRAATSSTSSAPPARRPPGSTACSPSSSSSAAPAASAPRRSPTTTTPAPSPWHPSHPTHRSRPRGASRHPTLALRAIRPPTPAQVRLDAGRPTTLRSAVANGDVVHCAGPWRHTGGWWSEAGPLRLRLLRRRHQRRPRRPPAPRPTARRLARRRRLRLIAARGRAHVPHAARPARVRRADAAHCPADDVRSISLLTRASRARYTRLHAHRHPPLRPLANPRSRTTRPASSSAPSSNGRRKSARSFRARASSSGASRAVRGSTRRSVVVELGPGTGGTTQALLRAMRPDAQLLAIEINPRLAERVRARIADPRLIVHCGSADDLADALAAHGLPAPDAVISGIPFSTMPRAVGARHPARDPRQPRADRLLRRLPGARQGRRAGARGLREADARRARSAQRAADAGLPLRVGRARRVALAALALKRERRARRLFLPGAHHRAASRSARAISSSARFRRTLRRRSRAGSKRPAATRRRRPDWSRPHRPGGSDPAACARAAGALRDRARAVVGRLGERRAPREDRIEPRARRRRVGLPRAELHLQHDRARGESVAAQPPRDRLRVTEHHGADARAIGDVACRRCSPRCTRRRRDRAPRRARPGRAPARRRARRATRRRACAARSASPRASAPIVSMPAARRRASATGPTPQSRPTGSGSRKARTSSGDTSQSPSGLASSLAIFATILVGAMPTETASSSSSRTARRSASPATRGGAEQALGAGEIEERLVERDRLHQRREAREDREHLARHRRVLAHVAAQEDPVGTEPPRLEARHRRVHAEDARLVARRRHHAARPRPADDHRLAAQLRPVALLDRRVERVHVGVQDDAGEGHAPSVVPRARLQRAAATLGARSAGEERVRSRRPRGARGSLAHAVAARRRARPARRPAASRARTPPARRSRSRCRRTRSRRRDRATLQLGVEAVVVRGDPRRARSRVCASSRTPLAADRTLPRSGSTPAGRAVSSADASRRRQRARPATLPGRSGGCGYASSRYSRICVES